MVEIKRNQKSWIKLVSHDTRSMRKWKIGTQPWWSTNGCLP